MECCNQAEFVLFCFLFSIAHIVAHVLRFAIKCVRNACDNNSLSY